MFNIVFHGIGRPQRVLERGERELWVDTDMFLKMLDRIRGQPDFWVTFDDSNSSDVEIALPALLQRGMKGHFFVLAGRLGLPGSITAPDLRALKTAGMVIGSHGMHHRSWRRLDPHTLQEELYQARDMIAQIIGCPVATAAFPFGAYDRRSVTAVRKAGFTQAYTCDRGAAPADKWLQTRTAVYCWDTPESLMLIKTNNDRVLSLWRHFKGLIKRWR